MRRAVVLPVPLVPDLVLGGHDEADPPSRIASQQRHPPPIMQVSHQVTEGPRVLARPPVGVGYAAGALDGDDAPPKERRRVGRIIRSLRRFRSRHHGRPIEQIPIDELAYPRRAAQRLGPRRGVGIRVYRRQPPTTGERGRRRGGGYRRSLHRRRERLDVGHDLDGGFVAMFIVYRVGDGGGTEDVVLGHGVRLGIGHGFDTILCTTTLLQRTGGVSEEWAFIGQGKYVTCCDK